MADLSTADLKNLFLQGTPLIDVRAPCEFSEGTLPGAINLPILENDERAAVGTAYKQRGPDAAIELGHRLVSGEVRDSRIESWKAQIRRNPGTVLFCFRGGLRSKTAQVWLREAGIAVSLIEGGYKDSRRFLRAEMDAQSHRPLLTLTGFTGSGKTTLLKSLPESVPYLDLEALARHRGSAFGATSKKQPTQIDFENALAMKLMQLPDANTEVPTIVEDESRMIGSCVVPEILYNQMQDSEVIFLEEPLEVRVTNIFAEYVSSLDPGQFARFRKAIQSITRKLGGVRTQEVLSDLTESESRFVKDPKDLESNRVWIGKLLSYYYDPLYTQSLSRRSPKIVFRGRSEEVREFLIRLKELSPEARI